MQNTESRFTCYGCKASVDGAPVIFKGKLYCPFCRPSDPDYDGPYIEVHCGNCDYDFVGGVANGMPECPKCGNNTLPLIPPGHDDGIDEIWDELRQELWPEELEEESFW